MGVRIRPDLFPQNGVWTPTTFPTFPGRSWTPRTPAQSFRHSGAPNRRTRNLLCLRTFVQRGSFATFDGEILRGDPGHPELQPNPSVIPGRRTGEPGISFAFAPSFNRAASLRSTVGVRIPGLLVSNRTGSGHPQPSEGVLGRGWTRRRNGAKGAMKNAGFLNQPLPTEPCSLLPEN
jgi:hypothetical protein